MSRFLLCTALMIFPTAFAADPPPSTARPVNPNDARKKLGLLPNYAAVPRIGAVKVAVLDSGFAGVGDRPYLPKSAVVVEHYDPAFVTRNRLGDPAYQKPFVSGEAHGRILAQLVWATAGGSLDGPQFYLLNANGPTLFRRAVKYAIEVKADVILFGGTFEGAGNYDGKGPVNAAVDEAVAAGIIWVNAAGNSGGAVYDGPITPGPNSYLLLSGNDTALHLRNRLDEHAVTVTLTWNDYRNAEDAGTTKDLDLFVEDVTGRTIGQSTLRQVPPGRPALEGESTNPRERIVLTDLAATPIGGEYRIRVKAAGGTFGPTDRIRVLVAPTRTAPLSDPNTGKAVLPVELLEATNAREIYPPADHPGVLTVGDPGRASAVGPTADGRTKPDVVLDFSAARFSNGEESDGSSNAAAYFAGVVAVLRAAEPSLTAAHVREWVWRLDRQSVGGSGRTASVAGVVDPGTSRNATGAIRYATQAANDQKARGLPAPGVYVSGSGGTFRVLPGGTIDPNPVPSAPVVRRAPPLHAPWKTPSPAALAGLVNLRE